MNPEKLLITLGHFYYSLPFILLSGYIFLQGLTLRADEPKNKDDNLVLFIITSLTVVLWIGIRLLYPHTLGRIESQWLNLILFLLSHAVFFVFLILGIIWLIAYGKPLQRMKYKQMNKKNPWWKQELPLKISKRYSSKIQAELKEKLGTIQDENSFIEIYCKCPVNEIQSMILDKITKDQVLFQLAENNPADLKLLYKYRPDNDDISSLVSELTINEKPMLMIISCLISRENVELNAFNKIEKVLTSENLECLRESVRNDFIRILILKKTEDRDGLIKCLLNFSATYYSGSTKRKRTIDSNLFIDVKKILSSDDLYNICRNAELPEIQYLAFENLPKEYDCDTLLLNEKLPESIMKKILTQLKDESILDQVIGGTNFANRSIEFQHKVLKMHRNEAEIFSTALKYPGSLPEFYLNYIISEEKLLELALTRDDYGLTGKVLKRLKTRELLTRLVVERKSSLKGADYKHIKICPLCGEKLDYQESSYEKTISGPGDSFSRETMKVEYTEFSYRLSCPGCSGFQLKDKD